MPARLRGGPQQSASFETLRLVKSGLRIVYTPRLALWAEEGPVELQVVRFDAAS
jgi:hypothetical protein